jgi:hypothetical protein
MFELRQFSLVSFTFPRNQERLFELPLLARGLQPQQVKIRRHYRDFRLVPEAPFNSSLPIWMQASLALTLYTWPMIRRLLPVEF